jgi:hypothetical protein
MDTGLLMIAFICVVLVIVAIAVVAIRENASIDERARVEPTLYASAGEIVTCLNGHEICEIAKDIFVAEMISVAQFKNWRHQPQPQPHDEITPCMSCGAPYVNSTTSYGGTRLHIDGKWRTTRHDT